MKTNDFLEEKTKELAKPVKDFTKVLALYEGEPDEQINKQCLDAYYKGVEAVRVWLSLVELINMTESKYRESFAVLHLPDDDIENTLIARSILSSNEVEGEHKRYTIEVENYVQGYRELIRTPIGELSDMVLEYVLGVADNPVMLLYNHFGDLLHGIHNILSMPIHDEVPADVVLTAELLAEHGIQDVIGVYKMDKLLFDISDFFENYVIPTKDGVAKL